MLTNNVDKLDVGMGQYTFLLNDRGGIIDDLIVYRIDEQKYLLVVNAARADEDFAWLQNHLKEGDLQIAQRRTGDRRSLLANKSQRGFWRSGHSRPADHGIISCALR